MPRSKSPAATPTPIRGMLDERSHPKWTFLTNHCHVIICVLREPDIRVRELALEVGITERAILKILGDLESDKVLTKTKVGRRNHYEVNLDVSLRHPLEAGRSLRQLVKDLK